MHFRQKERERKRERCKRSLRRVYEKLPRFVFVRNIRELPRIINRFALLWISSANNINAVAKKMYKTWKRCFAKGSHIQDWFTKNPHRLHWVSLITLSYYSWRINSWIKATLCVSETHTWHFGYIWIKAQSSWLLNHSIALHSMTQNDIYVDSRRKGKKRPQ